DSIIRPILRGKHIKKYGKLNQTEWLILIPCGWTNKNRKEKDPELFFKETYPAIYDHFITKSKLESKGKGLFLRDDKGNYWWELRPCDYLLEFEKEKILYIDIMTDNEEDGYPFPAFSFAKNGVFTLNTAYFIVGNNEDLKYILGLLNSIIGRFIVKSNVTPLQRRQYRIFQHFMEKFFIPVPDSEIKKEVVKIVDNIILKKSLDLNSNLEESLLNNKLAQFCDLSEDEISFIDSM
ncbi:MAG: type II restriction endonuclease subunit M, partial [Bacteroidetes bacterium HGW-Bacteroidetes-23]